MPEDLTTPPSADPATMPVPTSPAAGATPPADPADPDLGDAGKRALAAERTARRAAEKSSVDALAALKVFQDRDLSELERAQADATTSREAAAKATSDALRWRTAAHHGISDADAELFLTGGDEATLTAQAVRFAALNTAPRTPAPDPGQGPRGTGPASADDLLYESLYPATPSTGK